MILPALDDKKVGGLLACILVYIVGDENVQICKYLHVKV